MILVLLLLLLSMQTSLENVFFDPEECQCGLETVRMKMINGKAVNIPSKPWNTQFGRTDSFPRFQDRCEGTLISDRHVLTTARCAKPFEGKEYDLNFSVGPE